MTREAYERQNHFRRANEFAAKLQMILTIGEKDSLMRDLLLLNLGNYKSPGKDRNSGGNRRRNYNTMSVKRASKTKHNRTMRGG